ncbi:alpha/beta fold hydrolase [Methyloceanibacter sp.]|uniref:thioesterase domain-containing protein n=1 Tax=Methyloceanibacter sp. TaxID=1965321 RepID=UPI003D6CAA09
MIARESLDLQTPYELPAGSLEALIAGVFAEVFELDRIGAADEFFDVGGDSLLGEVLSEQISQRTGQDFKISDLFEHGSPREIARFLSGKSSQPAMGAGGRPPIFLIHGRVGFTLPKPSFRKVFGEDQEFHVFELPGIRGGQSYDRIEDIAAVYVAQLVERHPQGPILIVSFCVGALIALEMAAQLAVRGRPIAQLVMLDPSLPKNRGVDLKRERKRKAQREHGEPPLGPFGAQALWQKMRDAAGRIAAKREDPAETLQSFREKLLTKEERGRSKMPGVPQSLEARAKLQFALSRYKPRKFDGPVEILASPERELDSSLADLLPRRRTRLVFEEHGEISTAKAASLMQSIFEEALADAGSSPPHELSIGSMSLAAREA